MSHFYDRVSDLLAGLRAREVKAQIAFKIRFEGPFASWIEEACAQQERMAEKRSTLVDYALRWAMLYLLARPGIDARLSTDENDWKELSQLLKIALFRLFLSPEVANASVEAAPFQPVLQQCEAWNDLGSFRWAAGQWPKFDVAGDACGAQLQGENLSVFLMDGMGKSYLPRLIVEGVKSLWQQIVATNYAGPAQVLQKIQIELAAVVPEGFFAEGVVARILSDHKLEVASAGGGHLIQRDDGQLQLTKFAGPLLGDVHYGDDVGPELHERSLPEEMQLVFATDGLLDQFEGYASLQADVEDKLVTKSGGCLHRSLCQAVEQQLKVKPQVDDITWIAVRTLDATKAPEPIADIAETRMNANCRECPPFDCAKAVELALRDDVGERDRLVAKMLPKIQRKVKRICRGDWASLADDASQTAMLLILAKLSTWRQEAPFCKWAEVVAYRAAITTVADHSRLPSHGQSEELGDSSPSHEKSYDVLECLKAKFADFKPKWREVFILVHEGKLTRQEIADSVGCSRKTVFLWLNQMRELLSECLD